MFAKMASNLVVCMAPIYFDYTYYYDDGSNW